MVAKLVKIQRRFLWGGGHDQKKIAWISWEKVCLPKERGGLGIKDVKAFNIALLGKWKWHLLNHHQELWIKVVESKYGGWRGLEEGDRVASQSIWWRDLKRVVCQTYQGRSIQEGFSWKVGAGHRINFWEDRWISQDVSLAEKYPRLYPISLQQHHSISQMGHHTDQGWEWHFTWRRNFFDSEVDLAVNFLGEVEGKIFQQHGEDGWVWTGHPSGIYSAQSAYLMLREGGSTASKDQAYVELWKLKIPSKIAIFAWRLFQDKLPTKSNLLRRQLQLTDVSCPFCGGMEEEASHLFFHCSKIRPIWWETTSWLNITSVFPSNPIQHFL